MYLRWRQRTRCPSRSQHHQTPTNAALANLLGHSSISVTGDLYGHAEDATTRGAIDGLSDALGL